MRKKDDLLDAISESLLRREHIFAQRTMIMAYAESLAAQMKRPTGESPATAVDALGLIIANEEQYQGLVRHIERELEKEYA